MPLPIEFSEELAQIVPAGDLITDAETVLKRSRDYYWFSPYLERELAENTADAVYTVQDEATLRSVISLACKHKVPLHLRGGATGNFGQAVPLCDGLLVDFSSYDQVISIEGNCLRAQAGTRCRTIEDAARDVGLEMPCYPSTWAKATIAGFAVGGSGGVGGMRNGLLQHNNMIQEITLLTIESEPQTVTLRGSETTDLIHSFGAVALITEVVVRLEPKESWDQLIIAGESFEELFEFAAKIADDRSLPLRTMCFLENPLPHYCKPIRKHLPPDQHTILVEVAQSGTDALRSLAVENGYTVPYVIPHAEPRRSPMLSDFVQGHSILWALKGDERLASLSVFLSVENWKTELAEIRPRLGHECFIQADFHRTADQLLMQSSLLFPYQDETHLKESLDTLREMGILRFNSHDPYIGSKLNPERLSAKKSMKEKFDPAGLLSPGRFG